MKDSHVIIGIHLTDRVNNATELQKVLSRFGCSIKTRLGLHEASDTECSPEGIILLEFTGDEKEKDDLIKSLEGISGVETQTICFDHN